MSGGLDKYTLVPNGKVGQRILEERNVEDSRTYEISGWIFNDYVFFY
jgi:hypothetical protein